jgi:hypothetical protein
MTAISACLLSFHRMICLCSKEPKVLSFTMSHVLARNLVAETTMLLQNLAYETMGTTVVKDK